jgi:hypothetical protein
MMEFEIFKQLFNAIAPEGWEITASPVRAMQAGVGKVSSSVQELLGDSAGRITDSIMRHGVITGTTQAIAEAAGMDRGIDIGAGLRYQALGKNLFDENKTLWDSMSAWAAISKDIALAIDVLTGKDNTEASMKKVLASLRTTIVHDFITQQFLLPPLKDSQGAEIQSGGKDTNAIYKRTVVDDIANAMGSRSTRAVNEGYTNLYQMQDARKQQKDTALALQGLLDLVVRKKTQGKQAPILQGREPMAVKRLQNLQQKYPDMEPFLNTIQSRYNEEVLKKELPVVIRNIEKMKPYELKRYLAEYQDITGTKVVGQDH